MPDTSEPERLPTHSEEGCIINDRRMVVMGGGLLAGMSGLFAAVNTEYNSPSSTTMSVILGHAGASYIAGALVSEPVSKTALENRPEADNTRAMVIGTTAATLVAVTLNAAATYVEARSGMVTDPRLRTDLIGFFVGSAAGILGGAVATSKRVKPAVAEGGD